MIEVEESVMINRPVEEVFAFLTDHRNDIRWQEGLLEARVTPDGSVGVGTLVTAIHKFLSRRSETTIEINGFVPNQKETFKTVAGPLDVTGSTSYEPYGRSTVVTQRLEMQTNGFFSVAEALVASSLRRNIAVGLGDAKDLLEGAVRPSGRLDERIT